MKQYRKILEEIECIDYTECDVCERKISSDDWDEHQEIVSIDTYGGYGSLFGDGTHIRLDICQYCVEKMLGKYIEKNWERENG